MLCFRFRAPYICVRQVANLRLERRTGGGGGTNEVSEPLGTPHMETCTGIVFGAILCLRVDVGRHI